jgi:hypothetical protein
LKTGELKVQVVQKSAQVIENRKVDVSQLIQE